MRATCGPPWRAGNMPRKVPASSSATAWAIRWPTRSCVPCASSPTGMTRNELREHFGRNRSSDEIGRALGRPGRRQLRVLHQGGDQRRAGPPAERWFARQ